MDEKWYERGKFEKPDGMGIVEDYYDTPWGRWVPKSQSHTLNPPAQFLEDEQGQCRCCIKQLWRGNGHNQGCPERSG